MAGGRFRCFTWNRSSDIKTFIYDNPIDALTCGVDYLKKGYHVRLGNECVAALDALKIPQRKPKGNTPNDTTV